MPQTTTPEHPDGVPPAPAPQTVHEAIARVMAELPGIGKLSPDEHRRRRGSGGGGDDGRGISYAYRSIEQILAATQQLCGRYGLSFVPQVRQRDRERYERTSRSGNTAIWTEDTLRVMYWAVGPAGARLVVPVRKEGHHTPDGLEVTVEAPDPEGWYLDGDCLPLGPFWAYGTDNADKGLNKAMTQAYKQMLTQLFQIGDPTDEGEHERVERERVATGASSPGADVDQRPVYEQMGYADEDELRSVNDSLKDMMRRVRAENRGPLRELFGRLDLDPSTPLPAPKAHVPQIREALQTALALQDAEADEAAADTAPAPQPAATGDGGPAAGPSGDPTDQAADPYPDAEPGPDPALSRALGVDVPADVAAEMREAVKALATSEVDRALGEAGLPDVGKVSDRRDRLVEHIVRRRLGVPVPEAGTEPFA